MHQYSATHPEDLFKTVIKITWNEFYENRRSNLANPNNIKTVINFTSIALNTFPRRAAAAL